VHQDRPFSPGTHITYLHQATNTLRRGTIAATGPYTVTITGHGGAQYESAIDLVWHETSRGPVDPVPCQCERCQSNAVSRIDINGKAYCVCQPHAAALRDAYPVTPLTV
jgi:hypothetical protein